MHIGIRRHDAESPGIFELVRGLGRLTESAISSVAWGNNGLQWSFTYNFSGNHITVAHNDVSGISAASLKSLLDSHPEGIVLYCGNIPHAVFLTDYEGNTFYCSDPYGGDYSGKRIALASSYLKNHYSSQSAILSNTTAYWYVSDYSITKGLTPLADGFSASVLSTTTNKAVIYASIPKSVINGAGYKVYQDGELVKEVTDSNISSWNTDHVQWTVWNLDAFTDYSFKIWLKTGGKTNTSKAFSGTTETKVYPGLSVSKVKERQVSIRTTFTKAVVTAAGYIVYDKGGNLIKEVTDSNISSWNTDHLGWTIWSLEPGRDYQASIWYNVGTKTYTTERQAFSTAPVCSSRLSAMQTGTNEITCSGLLFTVTHSESCAVKMTGKSNKLRPMKTRTRRKYLRPILCSRIWMLKTATHTAILL